VGADAHPGDDAHPDDDALPGDGWYMVEQTNLSAIDAYIQDIPLHIGQTGCSKAEVIIRNS